MPVSKHRSNAARFDFTRLLLVRTRKRGAGKMVEECRVCAVMNEAKARNACGARFIVEPGLLIEVAQVGSFNVLGVPEAGVLDDMQPCCRCRRAIETPSARGK